MHLCTKFRTNRTKHCGVIAKTKRIFQYGICLTYQILTFLVLVTSFVTLQVQSKLDYISMKYGYNDFKDGE